MLWQWLVGEDSVNGAGDPEGKDPGTPSESDANELDGRASWKFLGKRLSDLIFYTMVNMGAGGEEKGKKISNSEGFIQGTAREIG